MDNASNEQVKIVELEGIIDQLTGTINDKNKELKEYHHLSGKYKRLKKRAATYKRDRIILFLFSLVLIGLLCYQGYKANKMKIQQQQLLEENKSSNPGGGGNIYEDPGE